MTRESSDAACGKVRLRPAEDSDGLGQMNARPTAIAVAALATVRESRAGGQRPEAKSRGSISKAIGAIGRGLAASRAGSLAMPTETRGSSGGGGAGGPASAVSRAVCVAQTSREGGVQKDAVIGEIAVRASLSMQGPA